VCAGVMISGCGLAVREPVCDRETRAGHAKLERSLEQPGFLPVGAEVFSPVCRTTGYQRSLSCSA
jgi:hypothetical protein